MTMSLAVFVSIALLRRIAWCYLLSVIPGKKGASERPMKNLQTANPAPLVMAGMQIVPMLQAIIIDGKSHLGSAFASQRLPGS